MTLPITEGIIPNRKDINKNLIHEKHEHLQLSVTTTDSSVSYTNAKTYHLIYNVGSSDAYVKLDATATTSSFKVSSGNYVVLYGSTTSIHAITSSGTADLRIIGFGDN